MSASHASLWGIVLAGGEGERLKGFVREQFGTEVPKQFCAFFGERTMLERTIQRARLLIPSKRLVVVGTAHHHQHIFRSLGPSPPGTVLLQPANRDTAPGILLPLIHILQKDPQALVVILPSDHFVLPGYRFMRAVQDAAQYVARTAIDRPILLAIEPSWPEPEYGWIEPGEALGAGDQHTIQRINRFIEKPTYDQVESLMRDGWLWNTMVIVARAPALITLVRKRLPELTACFTLLQRFLGTAWEHDLINEVYQSIPKVNFSTSVLAARSSSSLLLRVRNVRWSDLGTKERIISTLAELGLFPPVSVRGLDDGLAISAKRKYALEENHMGGKCRSRVKVLETDGVMGTDAILSARSVRRRST